MELACVPRELEQQPELARRGAELGRPRGAGAHSDAVTTLR